MDYELMMNGTVKIGQPAPDFTAETTYGPVCLDDYKGKWLVLFSHPGDFTPVKSPSLGVSNHFFNVCFKLKSNSFISMYINFINYHL